MAEAIHPGPVAEAERHHGLDVLRGLAVLGILVTNIQHFAMFAGTTRDPTLWGNLEGADFWVYALTYNLAYQKFLPIFSMLFGAGMVLAAGRREAAELPAAPLHYRRMAVLLLVGLVHAYLIWYGDILFAYAVCGMAVFPLRRLRPGALVATGVALLAMGPLIEIVVFVIPGMLGAGGSAGPSVEEWVARDLEAYRGPWIEQLKMRAHYAFEVQTQGLPILLFWRASGIMLLGMAAFKWGLLTGKLPRGLYGGLIALALLVALPVTALGFWANLLADWESYGLRLLGAQIIYWFGIVMSLGLVGAVMLALRGGRGIALTRPLAAVGRLALTCYLLESLICTTFFYGHGLGLYGRVERTGQAAVVAGVWMILLVGSSIWLRWFRYGPAEWLWRWLAYGRRPPLRRSAAS